MRPRRDKLSEALLADSPDSHVLVLPRPPGPDGDALAAAWKAACDEAISAYQAWRDGAGKHAFAVYRAAADREDAAAAALAERAVSRRTRWHRMFAHH
jgi:hypothetical protein